MYWLGFDKLYVVFSGFPSVVHCSVFGASTDTMFLCRTFIILTVTVLPVTLRCCVVAYHIYITGR